MTERKTKDTSISPPSTVRFWNISMAVGWLIAGIICVLLVCLLSLYYIELVSDLEGLNSIHDLLVMIRLLFLLTVACFLLLLCCYSMQASFVSFVGIVVRQNCISIPRSIIASMPVLLLGRMEIAFPTEIIVFKKFMGLERVRVRALDKNTFILFSSRKQRHAFCRVVKERSPNIEILRRL
jgi:hypothetical protein